MGLKHTLTKKQGKKRKQKIYKMRGCSNKNCTNINCKNCKHYKGLSGGFAELNSAYGPLTDNLTTQTIPTNINGIDSTMPNTGPIPHNKDFFLNSIGSRGGKRGRKITIAGSNRQKGGCGCGLMSGGKTKTKTKTKTKNNKTRRNNFKKQKGGTLSNFMSQDLLNLGRQFQHGVGTAYNGLAGYSAPVSPLPWKGQLPNTPNLATMRTLSI
jgi:hypothetical protein